MKSKSNKILQTINEQVKNMTMCRRATSDLMSQKSPASRGD